MLRLFGFVAMRRSTLEAMHKDLASAKEAEEYAADNCRAWADQAEKDLRNLEAVVALNNQLREDVLQANASRDAAVDDASRISDERDSLAFAHQGERAERIRWQREAENARELFDQAVQQRDTYRAELCDALRQLVRPDFPAA